MTNELDTALHAAKIGGAIVLDHLARGASMRTKESYNLVSDADVESEQAIVAAIRSSFPDHSFLGEESHSAAPDAEHLWVIDPLDGTNNFAHRVPHFAVSIAYCRKGRPEAGVVLNPCTGETFTAIRGGGAYVDGEPARVSTASTLDKALVGTGFYYDRGAMMEATLAALHSLFKANVHGIRRFGAASLDLCYVGCGRFDAYFEYELSAWDFAAGMLFVEEAGGMVTSCRGEALELERSSMLASNAALHQSVRQIVERELDRAASAIG